MDRRTFLKSASMKGTAIVTASAVGTEMLHAAESIGASDVASGKRNAPKAKRLPEDLQELVKDSSLLRKPDNLTVACYTFPNYHASALHDKIYGPGWTEYNLVRSARPCLGRWMKVSRVLGKNIMSCASRVVLMC